jgi:hypothetical protein
MGIMSELLVFKPYLTYILALLLNQESKFKQYSISSLFNKSTKSIRSFLNNIVDFNNLFLTVIRIFNIDLSKGYFSIDDTSYSKPYSNKLKYLSILFDHASKGYTKGLVIVFICWSNGKITLPISFKIWHQFLGKTKIELALELIKYAREISKDKHQGFKFDSFYTARNLLGYLQKNHLFFACRLAKSRNVLVEDKLIKLKSIPFGKRCLNVWLPGVGKVWITKYGGKFYCSNYPPDYQRQLYEWYAQRWCIEMVFRFCKSELKMQDCQGFSYEQHYNHIGFCFLTYGLLQGAFPALNPYEAKKLIESKLVTKVVTLKPEAFQLCA